MFSVAFSKLFYSFTRAYLVHPMIYVCFNKVTLLRDQWLYWQALVNTLNTDLWRFDIANHQEDVWNSSENWGNHVNLRIYTTIGQQTRFTQYFNILFWTNCALVMSKMLTYWRYISRIWSCFCISVRVVRYIDTRMTY